MANRFKFTKKLLEDLPAAPVGKRNDYYDTDVPKLQIRVTAAGRKSFYVRKHSGNTDRVLIGSFPDITIEQARKTALEICSDLANGQNPHEDKKKEKAQLSFGELLDAYLQNYANERCLAHKEINAVFRRYLNDWRDRKMNFINKTDVMRRVNDIGRENGHVAANHTITYARAAINWCISNGFYVGENPWTNVPKFKTQARERFLSPVELSRFFSALAEMDNLNGFRDYIYVSLFTGARRSNVFAMRWDEIDFDLGTWTIPRTKNGDSQTIPLTKASLDILNQRKTTSKNQWVFPGEGETGHLVEPKKAWHALLKAAQIEDLRLHDLRRTLGSYMAMGNQSLHIIGKVLGHRSPTATQIYSRFTHDPIRSAMEKAHQDMLNAASEATDKRKNA